MHDQLDFDSFREWIIDAANRGETKAVNDTLRDSARELASEHGANFRELITELPGEVWHRSPGLAAALGASYRSVGAPRGNSALGYFQVAEDTIDTADDMPEWCLAAVLIGHTAALRSLGQIAQARLKLQLAFDRIQDLKTTVPVRLSLGATWSLEAGVLDLHAGAFSTARRHLEYAHGLAADHLNRAEHIECLGAIALIDSAEGDFDSALKQVSYAKELAEGSDLMQTGYGAPAWLAELTVANERFDATHALAVETAAIEASQRNEWEPFALFLSAQLRGVQRHPIEALDTLGRAKRAAIDWDATGIGFELAEVLRAGLMLSLGHSDEAWKILQNLGDYPGHPVCPSRLTAELRLRLGDLQGAEAAIRDCEELGEAHCERTAVDIYLLRAAIEHERGNLVGSDVSAMRAFVTMSRTGARAPLQRIPAACLAAIATRALSRRRLPAVTAVLEEILADTAGTHREVEALSARERLVLAQVQRGLTVAGIASELFISPNTVKTHLRRLYRKLGVSTREDAIRAARSLGLDREITRSSPVVIRDSSEQAVV